LEGDGRDEAAEFNLVHVLFERTWDTGDVGDNAIEVPNTEFIREVKTRDRSLGSPQHLDCI